MKNCLCLFLALILLKSSTQINSEHTSLTNQKSINPIQVAKEVVAQMTAEKVNKNQSITNVSDLPGNDVVLNKDLHDSALLQELDKTKGDSYYPGRPNTSSNSPTPVKSYNLRKGVFYNTNEKAYYGEVINSFRPLDNLPQSNNFKVNVTYKPIPEVPTEKKIQELQDKRKEIDESYAQPNFDYSEVTSDKLNKDTRAYYDPTILDKKTKLDNIDNSILNMTKSLNLDKGFSNLKPINYERNGKVISYQNIVNTKKEIENEKILKNDYIVLKDKDAAAKTTQPDPPKSRKNSVNIIKDKKNFGIEDNLEKESFGIEKL